MFLKPSEKDVTRISSHAKIKGNLVSEGDVIIEGGFTGQIKTEGHLHIASGAKVASSIQCETARVDGTVEGEITAASRLEIGAGGVIMGNIVCAMLLIEPGAHLSGQCSMAKKREKIEIESGKTFEGASAKEEAMQILMGKREVVYAGYAEKQKTPTPPN